MSAHPRPRLSCAWLHACSGCEMALLNSGEHLLDLLDRIEIVHFPLLMDHKYGDVDIPDLPEADIGLVSGGVACEEHLAMLTAMRRQCRVLVSFGTCATHGGIPALRNQWPMTTALRTIYAQPDGTVAAPGEMSAPLDRVYSIDEKVPVDCCLPGCPPRPETIVAVIDTLLAGAKPQLPGKSVCEHCPTLRTGKGQRVVRRFLENAAYTPAEPLERMRCLLEQGLLCMGPVTAGGCGGLDAPLCIRTRVPCRGCYGPVRPHGNQLLDMLNALASTGVDHRTIVDRKSLLRFSGAHGLLKPPGKTG